ncbi:hypothetical protein SAMN04488535_1942 [Corynebacterium mycetoides]|uniref:Uncharacterized protein n=1 Tax=Corynebacterium mycetoides TaxID=38302 RepID=A0A1G9QI91_9CORY|nr:DUF6541 family protein [Corynebacterium mycetoides]SDM10733.1 hypothetical protein SAMN04488535_1942 [Corynebacterium mycetoides]
MVETLPLVLAAVALFVLPGAAVGWAAGMRVRWALASGVAITPAVWSVLAWAYGEVGVAVSTLSLVCGTVPFILLGLAWRYAFGGLGWRGGERRQAAPPSRWLPPVAGVAAGFGILMNRTITVYQGLPQGLSTPFLGWDVHWHASVIRFIGETGIGSSARMGELQHVETHQLLYYPTGLHLLAFSLHELTGRDIIYALNLTSLVVPGLGLTISVALLARLLLGGRGFAATLASGFAPVVAVGVQNLFYSEYHMGAWPYLAATSVTGIAACALAATPRRAMSVPAAGLTLAGVAALHPSAATVVVLIVGFWWLFSCLPGPHRLRNTLVVATAGVFGALLVLPQLLAGSGQAEEVAEFAETQLDVSRAESWRRALELQWSAGEEVPTQWWLIIAAGVGAVVLLAWRHTAWPLLLTLFSMALTAHALVWFDGPVGALFGAYTSLHYNNAHRLVLLTALLYIVLGSIAVAAVVYFLVGKAVGAGGQRARWGSIVLVALLAAAHVQWLQRPFRVFYEAVITISATNETLGETELAAFEWLKTQPRAYDGIIANNPGEGTGWMYPLHGLPSLHRHYLYPPTPVDSATSRIFYIPNFLGTGLTPLPGQGDNRRDWANIADFAARDLDATYYIVSPPGFWDYLEPIPAQVEGLWTAPGATPVYRNGDTVVFAINANLSDEEIRAARASGEKASPQGLPPLPFDARQGFPRPSVWDRQAAERDAQPAPSAG